MKFPFKPQPALNCLIFRVRAFPAFGKNFCRRKSRLARLFFLSCLAAGALSCSPVPKLQALVLPSKEMSVFSTKSVSEVSFLFLIDTSASMSRIRELFSENIGSFLDVAVFYPYYNYNFAIMRMSPLGPGGPGKASSLTPLFMADQAKFARCGLDSPSDFIETTSLGPYIRYTAGDLKAQDYEKLLCLLSTNILEAEGGDQSVEMYFHPVEHVLDYGDSNFSERFFSKENFLAVLFISEAAGDGFSKRLRSSSKAPAALGREMGEEFNSRLKEARQGGGFKIYAVAPLESSQDECGETDTAAPPYPYHVYRAVEASKGKAISICSAGWGAELQIISKDIRSDFQRRSFMLEDIPKTDTIEVFYNGYRLPKDAREGWAYNPETVSVSIGDQFFPIQHDKAGERGKFKIRYYPLNPDLARDSP